MTLHPNIVKYAGKKDPSENYKEFVTTNKPQARHPSS
jgi:hypothetical protein